jgi:hypothetical protein
MDPDNLSLRVLVEYDDEKQCFTASCLEFPGLRSQGATAEEATESIKRMMRSGFSHGLRRSAASSSPPSPQARGQAFERRVLRILEDFAARHPGFVEIISQPEVPLTDGEVRRPDFELTYWTDQEHRELIECQSRKRSSTQLADKIRAIKAQSARNRFIFVFEDTARLSRLHRAALEGDGVPCLSVDDLRQKIAQLDGVIGLLESKIPDLLQSLLHGIFLDRSELWRTAIERAQADAEAARGSTARAEGSSASGPKTFRKPYRGPSLRKHSRENKKAA